MAYEFPGAPACPDCGSIALCLQCNNRVREADAIARALASWASPRSGLNLSEIVERAVKYAEEG